MLCNMFDLLRAWARGGPGWMDNYIGSGFWESARKTLTLCKLGLHSFINFNLITLYNWRFKPDCYCLLPVWVAVFENARHAHSNNGTGRFQKIVFLLLSLAREHSCQCLDTHWAHRFLGVVRWWFNLYAEFDGLWAIKNEPEYGVSSFNWVQIKQKFRIAFWIFCTRQRKSV